MKITVLDGYTLNPGDLSWDGFKELGDVKIYDRTTNRDILKRAEGCEFVITNKTVLTKEIIEQLPKLKYIGILATGTNSVDVAFAVSKGITVTNIPAYSTPSVAQLTFALLLELCHSTALHSESVKNGEWEGCEDFCYHKSPLIELAGKTFGVVGFGRIGQETASIAKAFGMRIVYSNRSKKSSPLLPDAKQIEIDKLFKTADIISLNCPLTDATKNIINSKSLKLMKSSALLINSGRGPLVNEKELADALNSGKIAGYGTDVLSTEPPQANNPLI